MENKRKFSLIILMFILFILSYGENSLNSGKIVMEINKDKAIADGEDSIILSYKIIDDNGVPLRTIDKNNVSILEDGKEVEDKENLVFKSLTPKKIEVSIGYNDLKVTQNIQFEKDIRALKLSLSKKDILANGKDTVVIKALDQDGNPWENKVDIYVDKEKLKSNIFSTKEVGTYEIYLESGKFQSGRIKVKAYGKIEKVVLKADKSNIFSNKVDKINFNLESIDQNQKTTKIDNFVILDEKGELITKKDSFMTNNPGIYKVRAKYENIYSNYIIFKAKNPTELEVLSYYPQISTINNNTTIILKLNKGIKDYKNSVEVSSLDENNNLTKIDGSIIYDSNTQIISFQPSTSLENNKTYKVVLNQNLVGMDESKLKSDFNFSFKVSKREKTEMVKVEKGSFILGDKTKKLWKFSSPTQNVELTYDYLIGKTEVTFDQYDQYLRDRKQQIIKDEFGRGKKPVVNISWNDAINYANWLSKQEGLPVAYNVEGNLIDRFGNETRDITKVIGYRLPTEIEWEFAGRGGEKAKETLFSGSNDISKVAWYSENSNKIIHDVGTKEPNELGIYDMSGNVWEWVNDNSGIYSGIERINSVGPRKKGMKILRGGSFNSIMSDTQLAFREELSPEIKDIYYGFRLAKTIQEEK